MNVGYFSVQPEMGKSYIDYELLKKQKLINKTNFFRHVRFDKALKIRMDGRKRIAVVTWESP
jgi:hypothetical protein